MISITLALGIFGALMAGVVLHEASHAVAAELVGARVTAIDWYRLTVHFEISTSEPTWKDRTIGGAPFFMAAMLIIIWAVLPIPVGSIWTLLFACALTMNTIFVSLRDWRLIIIPRRAAN